jgi:hypothetical protein
LSKIQGHQITQIIIDEDIWRDDETQWWTDDYREDYWDQVHSGEMSWQWYMYVKQLGQIGWKEVVISKDHKVETVLNWLKANYPFCQVRTEYQHMLIEDPQVATMVALKWA